MLYSVTSYELKRRHILAPEDEACPVPTLAIATSLQSDESPFASHCMILRLFAEACSAYCRSDFGNSYPSHGGLTQPLGYKKLLL